MVFGTLYKTSDRSFIRRHYRSNLRRTCLETWRSLLYQELVGLPEIVFARSRAYFSTIEGGGVVEW